MALTSCVECGQQISTNARTCPHCGAPGPVVPPLPGTSKKAVKSNYVPGWIVLLTFAGLGTFIWWMAGGSVDSSPASPPKVVTQADKDADAGMRAVMVARSTVKSMLKDQDSAKFTNQFAVKTDKSAIVACGEVNAKNAFGGYAGAAVYVMQDGVVRLEGSGNANDVRRRWNATCAKFPAVYSKQHF